MDAAIDEEAKLDVYNISKYCKNGNLIIDVGANIGAFAVFAKSLFPESRIICIEPMADNFEVLKKNAGDFACLEYGAISNTNRKLTMYHFGSEASACHSIYSGDVKGSTPVQVNGISFESLVNKYKIEKVNFLKMDCQGAEFIIIPSISRSILKKIDYIALEIHNKIASNKKILFKVIEYADKFKELSRRNSYQDKRFKI